MKTFLVNCLLLSFLGLSTDLKSQIVDTIRVKANVDSLITTSRALISQKNYGKALENISSAENLVLKNLGKESIEYGNVCQVQGNLYNAQRNFSKAESLYLQAKTVREKVLGKYHSDYASSVTSLATTYWYTGNFEKAEPLFIEAKNIREKVSGKDSPDYTKSLMNLAILYERMGSYEKAEPFLLESKSISERIFGKETPNYALTVYSLGVLYWEMGKYEKAEPLALEAKNIREKVMGKENPDYASSLNNLANLNVALGNFEKAEQYSLEAKAIFEKVLGKENPQYAGSLNNLAGLYAEMGNYERAEKFHLEAITIREKIMGKSHPDYAASLNNLANLYSNMDNFEKAEPLYIEVKGILEKTLGKEHSEYAKNLYNLADLYWKMKRFENAEALFREAIDIREKTLGKDHPDYAISVTGLAILYSETGKYEKAEPLFLKAKAIFEEVLGKDHPYYVKSLNGLAGMYSNMGYFKKAEPLSMEVNRILEKVLGKENPEYVESLKNLAGLYRKTGNFDKAEPLLIESNRLSQTLINQASAHLSEQELAIYTQAKTKIQSDLLSFSISAKRKNTEINGAEYNSILFSKGLLLDGTKRLQKLSLTDPKTTAQFNELKIYKRRLAAEYAKPVANRDSTRVAELKAQSENLEKELTRAISGNSEARQHVRWQEVQKALKPGEAALEFVHFWYSNPNTTDSLLYGVLLLHHHDTMPQFIALCEEKQLNTLLNTSSSNAAVSKLYTTRNITPAKTTNLSGLYPIVWQPLDSLLQGVNTIYYSPSGLLHRVAFNAIPTDKPTEVLADRYRLYQLGSTRSLVTDADRTSNPTPASALLVGGIRYDKPKAVAPSQPDSLALQQLSTTAITEARRGNPQTRGEGFQYLPGTKKEVTQLEKLFAANNIPSTTFTDTSATEEQIKQLGTPGHPAPAVLHLATHGFFFPDPASKPTTNDGENHFSLLEHPLLRSGLALAGANQAWKNGQPLPGREDGILTAYEISNLNLTGTQLAVLSACETGLGDIQGSEGVYGLQRAFKIAGVERLIVTLWDVPDKETAAFMSLFYEKWLNGGKDIRAAFYETQTAMRQRYKDPFVWAAFVLVE